MILAAPLKQSLEADVHTKWNSEDRRYGNSTVDGGACVVGSHSRVLLVINIGISRCCGVPTVDRSGEEQADEQRSNDEDDWHSSHNSVSFGGG